MASFNYSTLSSKAADQVRWNLDIDLKAYHWLSIRKTNDTHRCITKCFYRLTTAQFKIRPQKDWNSKGREIYSRKDSIQIAKAICDLDKKLGPTDWYCEPFATDNYRRNLKRLSRAHSGFHSRMNALKNAVGFDIKYLKDSILFHNLNSTLVAALLELPKFLTFEELYLVATKFPLIIIFNHHLDPIIVTNKKSIFKKAAAILRFSKVKLYPKLRNHL